MKTFILIFMSSLIYSFGYTQYPQLFQNPWYLQNIIIEGENNYPTDSTFNGELYFNSEQINGVHNYCESGFAGEVVYNGISQFNLNDIVIAVENCNDPDILQFINKHYSVYFDNNTIPNNPLEYEISSSGSSKTLTITNPEGNQAIYGNELLKIQVMESTKFSVFPNPIKNLLNIKWQNEMRKLAIQIFTLEGKILQAENIENKNQTSIDVSNLSSGIYLLNIEDEEGNTETKKFLKE